MMEDSSLYLKEGKRKARQCTGKKDYIYGGGDIKRMQKIKQIAFTVNGITEIENYYSVKRNAQLKYYHRGCLI